MAGHSLVLDCYIFDASFNDGEPGMEISPCPDHAIMTRAEIEQLRDFLSDLLNTNPIETEQF